MPMTNTNIQNLPATWVTLLGCLADSSLR